MKYFSHGPAHFLNYLLILAYQTIFNTVCLDTRLKLTGLFKLWIASHSSSHSVMSQSIRSSSPIFHRHVARAFAPEFPILFSLKLSFFICTARCKTEVGFALNIGVVKKVDWVVIQFASFNFLDILTSSNKHAQDPRAVVSQRNNHFCDHCNKTNFCLVTAKGIKFNCHNCVCILFQYLDAVRILTPT